MPEFTDYQGTRQREERSGCINRTGAENTRHRPAYRLVSPEELTGKTGGAFLLEEGTLPGQRQVVALEFCAGEGKHNNDWRDCLAGDSSTFSKLWRFSVLRAG